MQGQQSISASSTNVTSSNSTTINASATGVSTAGTSHVNEKSITPTNLSNNTPPPSVLPATTANINGPGENDTMHSLDEQTPTSGDSANKDHS